MLLPLLGRPLQVVCPKESNTRLLPEQQPRYSIGVELQAKVYEK